MRLPLRSKNQVVLPHTNNSFAKLRPLFAGSTEAGFAVLGKTKFCKGQIAVFCVDGIKNQNLGVQMHFVQK